MNPRYLTSYLSRNPGRRWLWTAALLVLGAVGAGQTAQADCREVAEALKSALASRDPDAAGRHYDAVFREPTCSDTFRERTGRAVSLLHARMAEERMAASESLASQRSLLERGLGYARTWPILALLGDLAHDSQDYDEAAALYQEALVAIDDDEKTPRPPPGSTIERIFHRAEASRMLADAYAPAPITRSGAPGGLGAKAIRGISIKKVAVPITFRTGEAVFTEKGRRAAEDMAWHLIAERPSRITLAGHTDPRGTEAYNLDLSRRRVEAVARFLREQGIEAGQTEIVALAKGETERFPIDDPGAYTQEQRWQMDRRVELLR